MCTSWCVRVKETMADQVSFSVEAMVRGYHAYKDIWTAVNGEELPCQREDGNRVDAFAVATGSTLSLWQLGRHFCFIAVGLIQLNKVLEGLGRTFFAVTK